MFEFQLSVPLCTYILISAVMEGMWLLNPHIDSGHRSKALEVCADLREFKPLITRTPKENWRIHPQWVQRYWTYLFCTRMFSMYITVGN